MKTIIPVLLFTLLSFSLDAQVQYAVVTSIESIVPAGIGRSRMVVANEVLDYKDFTTERTQGTDSRQGNIRRRDIKIDDIEETKLLNFYSLGGINFQNVASNDAVISSKLNEMLENGWELAFVTSAVESDAGETDNNGIFITRYIFKRSQ